MPRGPPPSPGEQGGSKDGGGLGKRLRSPSPGGGSPQPGENGRREVRFGSGPASPGSIGRGSKSMALKRAPRRNTKEKPPLRSREPPGQRREKGTSRDVSRGWAWRIKIPSASPIYGVSKANNVFEFLAMAVTLWILVLECRHKGKDEQCILILGDNGFSSPSMAATPSL
jgi:hypothetical protein